jgi:hypothetical protein
MRHSNLFALRGGCWDEHRANFNVAFVTDMALREKQIQQNYRPGICSPRTGAIRNTSSCAIGAVS